MCVIKASLCAYIVLRSERQEKAKLNTPNEACSRPDGGLSNRGSQRRREKPGCLNYGFNFSREPRTVKLTQYSQSRPRQRVITERSFPCLLSNALPYKLSNGGGSAFVCPPPPSRCSMGKLDRATCYTKRSRLFIADGDWPPPRPPAPPMGRAATVGRWMSISGKWEFGFAGRSQRLLQLGGRHYRVLFQNSWLLS